MRRALMVVVGAVMACGGRAESTSTDGSAAGTNGTGGNGTGGLGGAGGFGGFGTGGGATPDSGVGVWDGPSWACAALRTDVVFSDAGVLGEACFVQLPGAPRRFEPEHLAVQIASDGGRLLYHVRSGSDCPDGGAEALGWYYDDPRRPTRIVFCPTACRAIRAAGGVVDVLVGCGVPMPP